jgi:uncharacterized membrane protein YhaH (DUF805 family)
MQYYLDMWKKYATFSGRGRRKEYWMATLFSAIASIILQILASVLGAFGTVLVVLYGLAVLVPSLALTTRRLHDIGKSGAWQLIIYIPCALWAILSPFLLIGGIAGGLATGDFGALSGIVILGLLALAGSIWMLALLCTAGTAGDNQYGADPKAGEDA